MPNSYRPPDPTRQFCRVLAWRCELSVSRLVVQLSLTEQTSPFVDAVRWDSLPATFSLLQPLQGTLRTLHITISAAFDFTEIQIHSESGFGFTGKSNGLDSWQWSSVTSLLFVYVGDHWVIYYSVYILLYGIIIHYYYIVIHIIYIIFL